MPDSLPIYRLSAEEARPLRLLEYAQNLFEINDEYQFGRRGNSQILRRDHRVVEIAGESGGVWAADESQLWKPGSGRSSSPRKPLRLRPNESPRSCGSCRISPGRFVSASR